MRKLVVAISFVGVLVVSPAFLFWWLVTAAHWTYDDDDLRAAVEGAWRLDYAGRSVALSVTEASAGPDAHASLGLVPSAAACGHRRTFVRDAAACGGTSTDMRVRIALGTGAVVDGSFSVDGTAFHRGTLRFMLDGLRIAAEILPDGQVDEATSSDGTFETVEEITRLPDGTTANMTSIVREREQPARLVRILPAIGG